MFTTQEFLIEETQDPARFDVWNSPAGHDGPWTSARAQTVKQVADLREPSSEPTSGSASWNETPGTARLNTPRFEPNSANETRASSSGATTARATCAARETDPDGELSAMQHQRRERLKLAATPPGGSRDQETGTFTVAVNTFPRSSVNGRVIAIRPHRLGISSSISRE